MTAKLFSKTGALAGTAFLIEKEALIGRDDHCDITLYPHTVSSQHARISLDEEKGVYYLEDLGSSNGTFVDKTRISAPLGLGKLHVITFANDVDMIFQVLPEGMIVSTPANVPKKQREPGMHTEYQQGFVMPTGKLPTLDAKDRPPVEVEAPDPSMNTTYGQVFDALPEIPGHDDTVITDTGAPSDLPGDDVIIEDASKDPEIPVLPTYTLIINTIKETGRRVVLNPGENILGRSAACSIVIQDEYLSSRHASLRVDADGVFLKDLGSSNGTFVENDAVQDEQLLDKGVIFRLGPTTKLVLE